MAASVNSSCAPRSPPSRSRPSYRMLLRWADGNSTFLRFACAFGLKSAFKASRAKSRTSSCSSLARYRVLVFGQRFSLDGRASHWALLARYFRRPFLDDLLAVALTCSGCLSHLHSLAVTMSHLPYQITLNCPTGADVRHAGIQNDQGSLRYLCPAPTSTFCGMFRVNVNMSRVKWRNEAWGIDCHSD